MIRERHALLPGVDFQASRKYHPELPGPSTRGDTALSLMKKESEMESPRSADIDHDMAQLFERDHQMHFEKEILAVIECKNPEVESIESRWHGLQRKVMITANGWGNEPKMLPYLQQCAADLFARMYFREFTENPKNKKYMKQGSNAILAQMKVQLRGLKLWSCVYKGLEWRVYDKFGDPEEEQSTPTGTTPVDIARLGRTIESLNKPWKLPRTADSHSVEAASVPPPLPNISCRLPVLTRPSNPPIIHKDPPPTVEVEVPKKTPIRLRIRIPQRQPPVIETSQSLTRIHEVPTQPTAPIIYASEPPRVEIPVHPPVPTESANPIVDNSATVPDYFINFYNQRCVKVTSDYRMRSTDFYKAYDAWRVGDRRPVIGKQEIVDERGPKIAKKKIGEYLKNLNIRIQKSHSKTYYYIRLKSRR